MTQQDSFIRISELANVVMPDGSTRPGVVPVSKPTIWRWIAEGKFPKPIKLGENVTVWRRSEIEAWGLSRSTEQASTIAQRQRGFRLGEKRAGRPRKNNQDGGSVTA